LAKRRLRHCSEAVSPETDRNVRILKEDLDGAGGLSIAARRSRERPSIAVLPCQVSAAEPDCRFFADYVTEGIATALCRVRSLSVVVPKSSRNFASRDPKRLSQCKNRSKPAPDFGRKRRVISAESGR
jgi:hypothetical protein